MTASTRPKTIVGRIAISAFLFIFLGFGIFFTYLLLHASYESFATRSWDQTPCRVEQSQGVATDDGYALEILYSYEYAGRPYTATTVSRDGGSSSDYAEVQRLVDRFAASSEAICYVNPEAPDEAVLTHGGFWMILFLPLPLVFVLIGGGGIILTWKTKLTPDSKSERTKSKATKALRGAGVGFFAIFLVIGLVVFWFLGARPLLTMLEARSWSEVPCTVISSQVRSHSSDDGTTYNVDILYEYEFGGRSYRSNGYGVLGGSSGGRDGKAEVVRAHPRGKTTSCWVNPADPYEALLERGFTPVLLFGLIPLVFVIVGAGGIYFTLRRRRRGSTGKAWKPRGEERSLSSFEVGGDEIYQAARGPIELEVRSSPMKKLIGMLFICAFWNGIVSVFVYQVVQGFARGRPEWFLTLFMIPFVLVGLGLILGVIYFFLAFFNPRPKLVVSTDSVPPGGTLALTWKIGRRAHRIRRLVMLLEGREEATYSRGTRTYTDKEYFARVEFLNTESPEEIAAGRATLTVPAGTMHSFEARHNKVIWTLRVHGDIHMWPNIDSQFSFRVLAAPPLREPEQEAEKEIAS